MFSQKRKEIFCALSLVFSPACFLNAATWSVVDSTGNYIGLGMNSGASGATSSYTGNQLPYQGSVDSSPQGTLAYCIWNAAPGDTINIAVPGPINLSQPLPAILGGLSGNLTLVGNGVTINGNGLFPIFAGVNSGGTITIENCVLQNGSSIGGAGGAGGGGGGTGGGGALYVASGSSVVLSSTQISNCIAQGGNGGSEGGVYPSGGGGGYGGGASIGGGGGGGHPGGGGGGAYSGEPSETYTTSGGGGGGYSNFDPSSGGNSSLFLGGPAGSGPFIVSGGGAGINSAGGTSNGGGGFGAESYGGGGGGSGVIADGGNGSGAGGGGASYEVRGGNGGPYGGGGGGGFNSGGNGGFGAGGGGAYEGSGGTSLALGGAGGAGNQAIGGGGGGSGLGGAILIQSGGILTIQGSVSFEDNQVIAGVSGGAGGGNGQALGTDIFIRSGGTLVFDLGSESLILANPIASDQGIGGGTGGGIQLSSGFLTLSGTNTYSGGTQIASGATLEISKGSVIGYLSSYPNASNNISNSGSLIINDSVFNYNGEISGSGDLNVQGSSNLTLSSMNPYTGNSEVDAGATLSLTGEIGTASDPSGIFNNYGTTALASGSATLYCTEFYNYGTLESCGYIYGDVYIETGSVFSTGCSITPTTIHGNLTFFSGSTLSPNIDPNGIATLNVTGTVNIQDDVSLVLDLEPGCYAQNTTLAVLEAGTLNGSFSTIEIGTILLTPMVSYTSNSATLSLARTPLTTFATSANQEAVAQSLECLLGEEGESSVGCAIFSKMFFFSEEEMGNVFNNMQPALFKGLTISQENNAIQVQETLGIRFQDLLNEKHCYVAEKENRSSSNVDCFKERTFHLWIDGFGDLMQQKNIWYGGSQQTGYKTKMGGGVIGFDANFSNFYIGALSSYTGSSTDWSLNQGKGTIDTVYGGLYVSAVGDLFYGNLSLIGGWSHFTGHRNIFLAEETLTATHSNGGNQLLSHIDSGLNFHVKGLTIRPFDSFDYVSQTENRYTEQGAGPFDLTVNKSNAILIRNELGLQIASCFCREKYKWTVSPKLSWVREVRVKGSSYTATFSEGNCPFSVTGYFPDRSLISPGLLISGSLFEDFLNLQLYFDGEYGEKFRNQNYGGQIRFGF